MKNTPTVRSVVRKLIFATRNCVSFIGRAYVLLYVGAGRIVSLVCISLMIGLGRVGRGVGSGWVECTKTAGGWMEQQGWVGSLPAFGLGLCSVLHDLAWLSCCVGFVGRGCVGE